MNQALEKAKEEPVDDTTEKWIESVVASLRKAVAGREYCTLEVEIYAGNIKRAVMKRSVVSPEQLNPVAEETPRG